MPYASGIQLINDPNGAAYAFLADNGAIWQCQWDAEAQRWEQGLQVPGALGGEKLQALYVDDLWPNGQTGGSGQGSTANAGIVLAYRVGEGNAAEIHASFGSWDSDGQLSWSASTPLSSDGVEDQAFTLMPAADGGFWLVAQKQEGGRVATNAMEQALALEASNNTELNAQLQQQTIGSRPDKDLYRTHFALQRGPTSGAEAPYTLLENGSAATTLASTDQPTTPQPAPQQRPFAGNSQLQRTDVLQTISTTAQPASSGPSTALILSSATAPTTSTAASQSLSGTGTASRGWSGGAWALGSQGGGGKASVGVSSFPFRWRFIPGELERVGSTSSRRIIEPIQEDAPISTEDKKEEIPETTVSLLFLDTDDQPESQRSEEIARQLAQPRPSVLPGSQIVEEVNKAKDIDSDASMPTVTASHGEWTWTGMFGGTNAGSGGTTVVDFAKGRFEYGTDYDGVGGRFEEGNTGINSRVFAGAILGRNNTWKAFTMGASLRSAYQFSGSAFNPIASLNSYLSQESLGGGFVYELRKTLDNASSLNTKFNINMGLLYQQYYQSSPDHPLPEWLRFTGNMLEYESFRLTTLKSAQYSKYYEDGVGTGFDEADGTKMARSAVYIEQSTRPVDPNTLGDSRFSRVLYVNPIIDFTNGFLIPATADTLLGTTYGTTSGGLGVFGEIGLDLKWLSKYGIGVEGMAASQTTYFFTGKDKGDVQEIAYASAGAAGLLGLYIPLISYLYTSPSTTSDSGTSSQLIAGSTGDTSDNVSLSLDSGIATGLSTGGYVQASSGAAYPLLYNPDFASNSKDLQIAGDLLAGNSTALYAFTLHAGASTAATNAAELITIKRAGSGLISTNGSAVTVDVLGTFIDTADASNRAKAQVIISDAGELESVQITSGGRYIYLAETGNNSGEYLLPLDLVGAGLVADPATAEQPLISIAATTTPTSSGLAASKVLRIASQLITASDAAASSTAATVYPLYDSQSNSTAAPNPINLKPYSYSGVPLQVQNADTGEAIELLNTALTARAYFSNGNLVGLQPDQAIIFSASQLASSGYNLVLDFTSYGQQLGNSALAALGTATILVPQAEQIAYNNAVSEGDFSAQAGATNAGVYLADGRSDMLPLFPEQGQQTVFNRVVYNDNNNVWFLNQTDGGVAEPDYINTAIDNGTALPSFSAAASPAALTIAPPPADSTALNIFGGDTLVAWVEATDPVIPLSSDNGEQNFQAFMQAFYGSQRINYRIRQSSATETSGWAPMDANKLSDLYAADGYAITQLRAFNTHNPNSTDPNDQLSLLAWVETPLPGTTGSAQLKVAAINPSAANTSWSSLTSDNNGNSTIQSIPWGDGSRAAALSIDDLSIASLPLIGSDGVVETPVLSFSRDVRTPYRQSVLEDQPLIYLPLDNLEAGLNSLNLGSTGPSSTSTFASETGLDFSIASALPLSQGTAVENTNGTGVLISGLGSNNGALSDLFNQIATDEAMLAAGTAAAIASVSGTVTGTSLTVSNSSGGSLDVGDALTGAGLEPGTTITAVVDAEAGTYTISQAAPTAITDGSFKAYPEPPNLTYTTLAASISGTTLSVSDLTGTLKVGDRIAGAGITPGTTITAVDSPYANGSGTYTVNIEQTAGSSSAPIAALSTPGASTAPYTLEFWTRLDPNSNPDGAGLVALGQPSTQAVGDVALPEGWLLASSFVVDRISYRQAAGRGLIESIPSSVTNSDDLYGWEWAVLADGANTTAMDGNGGSNLYSNALSLINLRAGTTLNGVTAFLEANGLTPSDLIGRGGMAANRMAVVPTTQLEFAHFIDPTTNTPQSNLNAVAVDTRSAALNEGLVVMDGASDTTSSTINTLFEQLWQFQKKTGEAKVNFSLAPAGYRLMQTISSTYGISTTEIRSVLNDPTELANLIAANSTLNTTDAESWLTSEKTKLLTADASADNPYTIDQFSGYQLAFALSSGPAVSVDGSGQLIFDVSADQSVLSTDYINATGGTDLRDGEWHYVVASFLPNTVDYITTDGSITQVPSNVGVASLYIDNQLVGQAGSVIDAFLPENGNDELVMLTNNVGGAIDQLALYNTALSSYTPPAASSSWDLPTSDLALELLREAGMVIDTKTPDLGASPGAVTAHWDARDVNPNDAELHTFYSTYNPDSGSWSEPSTLNPILAPAPTVASAAAGSLQERLTLSLSPSSWQQNQWSVITSSGTTASTNFNPSGLTLQSATIAVNGEIFSLTADQLLIGNTTLAELQPLQSSGNFNYTLLADNPALTLVLDPQNPLSSGTADITLGFSNGTSISTSSAFDQAANAFSSVSSVNNAFSAVENRNRTLATAAVIEQAPLQLKYIDSGETLQSRQAGQGFGTSQVAGSFANSSGGTSSGWLAISQPFSANATSDPAGRVWIQYTGQFTVASDGKRTAVSDPAQAPSTWLNALAQADFSPEQPTRPLLDAGLYPSSSGGLLIKADPTVGWGDQFGETMLSADINGDGVEDLVIAASHANAGGRVYIIDGTWIQNNLTTDNGATTLDLANPNDLGDVVTVLTPAAATDSNGDPLSTDQVTVAGFGTSLAFDSSTSTLWIGAPNYLRQLNSSDPTDFSSLQPIGALYHYNAATDGFNSTQPIALTPTTGSGGTTTAIGPNGDPVTTYWGSQYGTALAIANGHLAVSAPGVQAGLLYSGSEAARQTYLFGKRKVSDIDGDGALVAIQIADNVDISQGTQSAFSPIINQGTTPSAADSTYMQNLKALQTDQIAGATVYNNQALQADAVGAVYLYQDPSDLSSPNHTYYGPNPWNTLGPSGFGSSLAFVDLNNSNTDSLAIGASSTGGPGAAYLINPATTSNSLSSPDLGNGQQLAHLEAFLTLYGAEAQDLFGNGVVNLGDINNDDYDDLLIQAMNAASGAGNGYVLFGSDQFAHDTANPATGSVASGSIGTFQRADGSSFYSAILQELGYAGGFTGSGAYGSGDINADGINDIQLGSGQNNSAYLTWGHPYLEAISNLDLDKLASNTGYMLDGLATTTPGSLRSLGDFNGDGYGDFISIQPGTTLNTVRIELGANTQEILADYLYSDYTFSVSPDTQVLPAGDINGDGLADIALFINKNFSSAADGNQGAGSTTGILYGRSSEQLPLGSGFGFLSPIDPGSNTPLSPLPGQQISTGLSDHAPAIVQVGDTLYTAVKGDGSSSIWLANSSDGGNSWSSWTNLTDTSAAFSTDQAPALALFNDKLYLAFRDAQGKLAISSFDPGSTSLADWSTPLQIASTDSSGTATTIATNLAPTLISSGDALAVLWADPTDNSLYASTATTPDQLTSSVTSLSTPSSWQGVDGGSSPASPALARIGDQIYMAVQGNGDNFIYWTSSTDGGSSWADWQVVGGVVSLGFAEEDLGGLPSNAKPPSLAVMDGSLYLSYLVDSEVNNRINITRLIDAASNTWSNPTFIPGQSATYASLVTEQVSGGEQLAVYYVSNDSSDRILKAYTTSPPTEQSVWTSDLQVTYDNGAAVQTASGPLAVSSNNGQTVIAYQGGTTGSPSDMIYLAQSSSVNNLSSWTTEAFVNAGMRTGLGLSTSDSGTVLSYTDTTAPSELQLQKINYAAGAWNADQSTTQELITSGSSLVSLIDTSSNQDQSLLMAGIDASNLDVETSTINTIKQGIGASWSQPGQLLQRVESSDGISFNPIITTSAAAATPLGDSTVVAVNNNGTVNLYNTLPNSGSWQLASSFSEQSGESAISTNQAPGLTTTDTGLALTYTNTDNSVALQRLDFLELDGTTSEGVSLTLDGMINTADADLSWQTTLLNSGSGINTALPTAPVSVDGTLLLANIQTDNNNQIHINAVPNLGNPDSTSWINSTIQLPDGSGGWLVQQSGQGLTQDQSSSFISAVGDITGDGNSDLVVIADNVNNGQIGTRLIRGSSSSDNFTNINNPLASSQTVQVAESTGLLSSGSLGASLQREQLTISAASDNGSLYNLTSSIPANSTSYTASSKNPSSINSLFAGSSLEISSVAGNAQVAEAGIQQATSGSFGDLNGDGYNDYLSSASTLINGINGQAWQVWSVRAAGDVNGNGADDVLLALAPQGPAFNTLADNHPAKLETVLVDGSLFNISDQSFSLNNLKQPLDPYNPAQRYDDGTTTDSLYLQSLQNWFEPISSFVGGSATAAGIINQVNPTSTTTLLHAPSTAVNDQGEAFLVFAGQGAYDNAIERYLYNLSITYQEADGTWSEAQLPVGTDIRDLSPSATFFNDRLYIAYTDTDFNLHVAVSEGSPTDTSSTNWRSYPVITTVQESSQWQPTLVAEQGRLAMYFPSNDGGTAEQSIRYLYSTNPVNSSSWGSQLTATGYQGLSGILKSQDGSTPSVTSPIAATSYQGKTILAFRNYGSGNPTTLEPFSSAAIQLLTQIEAQPTSSNPVPEQSWELFNTGITNTNGVSLATDNSLLYMQLNTLPPKGNGSDYEMQFYSLAPKDGTEGEWSSTKATYGIGNGEDLVTPLMGDMVVAYSNNGDPLPIPISTNLFMQNGELKATWSGATSIWSTSFDNIQVADVVATISPADQVSLAGFSIDGNIDVNGDGFSDLLISDPSDPAEAVDNQYVLFGGDYLDIATWVGTTGDDVALGTPLADVIYTLAGDDSVVSKGGADVIYTAAGADDISITDNSFVRIDAGPGIDRLLLEGNANQDYDFRLSISDPEYFAGAKLKNIELISSIDYGANTLRFDPDAVAAFNDTRMLFVTPDSSDTIALSSSGSTSFQRDASFDTSYGGVNWTAYAAQDSLSSQSSSNPTLLYLLNPETNDSSWLDSQVVTTTTTQALSLAAPSPTPQTALALPIESADPTLPITSAIAAREEFGDGLTLTAFKTLPSDQEARFEISRLSADRRQVVSYQSSSSNSTAEPGLDYDAVVGQLVLEQNEFNQLITVPINADRFEQLRQGMLSLEVEERSDVGQGELHLVVSSQSAGENAGQLLSSFQLDNLPGEQASLLNFRTDTDADNDPVSASAETTTALSSLSTANAAIAEQPSAELTVHSRSSSDSKVSDPSTRSQTFSIHDTATDSNAPGFDHDLLGNAQVNVKMLLNSQPGSDIASLIGTDGNLIPLSNLGSIPLPPTPPTPSGGNNSNQSQPASTPPAPTDPSQPNEQPSQQEPVQPQSPLSENGNINYEAINSGVADFSQIQPEQYDLINWNDVDFDAIANSPGSAQSLNYGLINYNQIDSPDSFSSLASIIQYDDVTGANIRAIANNPNAQTAFQVVIGERGEKLRQQGSDLNDLFQVRGGGRLVASGGNGRDLFYSNSKKAEMVIKDFSTDDVAKLNRFGDRAVRKGKLQLTQDGNHAVISFKGSTLLTLRNTDADQLAFSQGSITLAPDPLA